ncbi:hypothetical protein [Roseibium sp. RKSG952]|uniref:hypothetical protein n=1 Tax=Roseibium sp. RKSG952 TaxID=2529384 RepID=UPI0012BC3519|nr:hypothetical protein [Roseibium sp. RKSG952]MTI00336.1 hypothetical protein [Roseibium sp. RKSG952]
MPLDSLPIAKLLGMIVVVPAAFPGFVSRKRDAGTLGKTREMRFASKLSISCILFRGLSKLLKTGMVQGFEAREFAKRGEKLRTSPELREKLIICDR